MVDIVALARDAHGAVFFKNAVADRDVNDEI